MGWLNNLRKDNRYRDYSMIFVVLFLATFGVIMIYSASYYSAAQAASTGHNPAFYMMQQLKWLFFGTAAMLLASLVPYRIVAVLWPLEWALGIFLMVLVDFTSLGKAVNGEKRWLQLAGPSTRFQPTELVKIAVIVTMAVLISKFIDRLMEPKIFILIAAAGGIPTILILMGNLSSAIILFGICAGMFLVATKNKKLGWLLLAFIVIVVLCAKLAPEQTLGRVFRLIGKENRMERIRIWNNPEGYEKGYQVLQGLYAIGSGGLLGKGLGNSIQKLGFIPEAHNDMIFCVICEELGLIGAIGLMLLYLFLIYRLMIIAANAPDLLGSLIATGVMIHIALQVMMNVAVATNFMPNTGVSLPFISYGGSSLLFLMAELGIVLNISRSITFED